jgi:autotransporter family porin
MKAYRLLGAVAVAATIALTGVASAQVVSAPAGPVNVTTTQSANGIVPGSTATNFGTIMLSAHNGGTYTITSLPITVTPGAGASTANLTGCQLMGSSGNTLTSGNNMVNTLGSGTNIFTFNTPLTVTGATTTLTVNCNVSSSAASGTTFAFTAGTPTLSSALGVILNTIASVPAGTTNALIGIITLDGTGSGTDSNVSSVPLTFSFNGAAPSDLTNCSLHSATNLPASLNTGNNGVNAIASNGGTTVFSLDTPFSVPAGSGKLIELMCNVSSATPVGSSVTVSVTPSGVTATNASTGSYVTPTASMSNGSPEPVSGTFMITAPGTAGSTTPVTTVPGTPNTGAGGNAAMNIILLALSAAAFIVAGRALLVRKA